MTQAFTNDVSILCINSLSHLQPPAWPSQTATRVLRQVKTQIGAKEGLPPKETMVMKLQAQQAQASFRSSQGKRRKVSSNVATNVNYGVASFLSWPKSMCNPIKGITSIRRPWRLMSPFQGEHLEWTQTSQSVTIFPKGKCLGSHVVGWKYPVHLDTPTTIEWTIGSRVKCKSSAKKVTIRVRFRP